MSFTPDEYCFQIDLYQYVESVNPETNEFEAIAARIGYLPIPSSELDLTNEVQRSLPEGDLNLGLYVRPTELNSESGVVVIIVIDTLEYSIESYLLNAFQGVNTILPDINGGLLFAFLIEDVNPLEGSFELDIGINSISETVVLSTEKNLVSCPEHAVLTYSNLNIIFPQEYVGVHIRRKLWMDGTFGLVVYSNQSYGYNWKIYSIDINSTSTSIQPQIYPQFELYAYFIKL